MGKCVHCGRPAGVFSEIHPGCFEAWEKKLHGKPATDLKSQVAPVPGADPASTPSATLAIQPRASEGMIVLGILVLVIGLISMIYALTIDTTVMVGSGDRVANMHQMGQRFTYLIAGGFAAVIGSIFIGFGRSKQ